MGVMEFCRLSEGRDGLQDGIKTSGLVDRVDLRSDFSINWKDFLDMEIWGRWFGSVDVDLKGLVEGIGFFGIEVKFWISQASFHEFNLFLGID